MKKKVTTTPVEAKATDATNAVETANTAISIREWWACEDRVDYILVQLADSRFGLLKVCLGLAFDERHSWCELNAFGNGVDGSKDCGHARYQASQVTLPVSLRKHILRNAISLVMEEIAESLTVCSDDTPEFSAYLDAAGMKSGMVDAAELGAFANVIKDCGLDGDDDGIDDGIGYVPSLRRLAKACKQLWGKSWDKEQCPPKHGFEYD